MSTDTETCSGRRTEIAPEDGIPVGFVAPGAATHPTDESLGLEQAFFERSEPRVYQRASTA
jgi:hypothetical protein